jgi:lipopolysaccharide export system permease protein
MKILANYTTRQTVITLFLSIGVFTFVLLLPTVLSFSLPMAMLTTALLVFGRMSADNPVTAGRASGAGLGRVAAPVILLSALMGAICHYMNTTLAPECRFKFRTLFLEMGTTQPMALIEADAYIRDFPGYVIYVGRKKENIIEDVTLYALDTNGNVISSLRAQKGLVKGEPQEKKLLLDLYNVRGDLRDPTNIRPGTNALRYPVPTP